MKYTIVFVFMAFCSLKCPFVVLKRCRKGLDITYLKYGSLSVEFKLDVYREMVTVPAFVFVPHKGAQWTALVFALSFL